MFLSLVEDVQTNVYAKLNKDLVALGESLIVNEFNLLKSRMR